MSLTLGLQGRFRALELVAEGGGLLSALLDRLVALLNPGCEALLGFVEALFGLLMQARGQASDQVLQCLADRCLRSHRTTFFLLQFPEVAVDGGFRAGVAQRHTHGVHRRVLALRQQAVASTLHVTFVQA